MSVIYDRNSNYCCPRKRRWSSFIRLPNLASCIILYMWYTRSFFFCFLRNLHWICKLKFNSFCHHNRDSNLLINYTKLTSVDRQQLHTALFLDFFWNYLDFQKNPEKNPKKNFFFGFFFFRQFFWKNFWFSTILDSFLIIYSICHHTKIKKSYLGITITRNSISMY